MKQKILNQVGVLLISSILVTFLVVSLSMYEQFAGYMKESVREEAGYICMAIEQSEGSYLNDELKSIATASRITLLDSDGAVLYDSEEDENTMENHSNRPEFQQAEREDYHVKRNRRNVSV